MTNNEPYKNVATKVNPEAYQSLLRLCKKRGIKMYEFLQMVIDTLIRYMDDRHNLSPEMEQAMSIFEHMIGWQDSFNVASTTSQPEISEATYYLIDGKKKGCRAVHVKKPFFGVWEQTHNIQEIIERTFCLIFPDLYRKLRMIGVDMGSNSIVETILMLIEDKVRESDLEELRQQFEDNDRSEFGKKPVSAPYRRKMRRDIEKVGTIRFDEEDKETTDDCAY